MNEWRYVWYVCMDGWMDGWMNGWMTELLNKNYGDTAIIVAYPAVAWSWLFVTTGPSQLTGAALVFTCNNEKMERSSSNES